MDMGLQISIQDPNFYYFGYMPKSVVSGPYGSFVFNFWRNIHDVYHRCYTILYAHQWRTGVSISPHLHRHLLSFILFENSTLMSMRWYLIVVLICLVSVTEAAL